MKMTKKYAKSQYFVPFALICLKGLAGATLGPAGATLGQAGAIIESAGANLEPARVILRPTEPP